MKNKITVVSCMKDEAPYILDWVVYNQSIGVTDFLIYTNDCSDNTNKILLQLNKMGVVNLRFNNVLRRGPHKSALHYS